VEPRAPPFEAFRPTDRSGHTGKVLYEIGCYDLVYPGQLPLPNTSSWKRLTSALFLSVDTASPPSQLHSGVRLVLNILPYAADFFGTVRVLMAMRFHALIVTMAMISSASLSSPNSRFASS
jgi:hypothetical protein